MFRFIWPLVIVGCLAGSGAIAQFAGDAALKQYFELTPGSTEDLANILKSLEKSLSESLVSADPIVVILHGAEAAAFTRKNYLENKALVDRAALLDAHKLIDVQMCSTWMQSNNIEPGDLPAFIEPVPYAPAEIERLRKQGYEPYETTRM